ncbi:hypothetical protein [Dactylosporangium cerinum]|uniref:hypothetical protein n=1 Tax=Dactylosporangium cerinum TaxID=1434730 RepID=UPI0036D4295C
MVERRKPGEPVYAPYFTNATSDSCWRSQNATVVFDGHSGELVLDDATGMWRLASDDGSKFELLTGATKRRPVRRALEAHNDRWHQVLLRTEPHSWVGVGEPGDELGVADPGVRQPG